MFRMVICWVPFVLLLSLVGYVQAQDATWTDATGNHLWSTPGNWSEFPPCPLAQNQKWPPRRDYHERRRCGE
jgi:hypothetical protein